MCEALLLLFFELLDLSLHLFLHSWTQVIRIEVAKVLILRLPIYQNVAFVTLVTNAEENEQLDQKDAHVKCKCQKD